MGAWGHGTLENDSACDWVYSLEATHDFSAITTAFDEVLNTGHHYLDVDIAQEALAAVEALVYLRNKTAYPEKTLSLSAIDTWAGKISGPIPSNLIEKAQATIKRIIQPPSELLSLWEAYQDDFLSEIEALKNRLIN